MNKSIENQLCFYLLSKTFPPPKRCFLNSTWCSSAVKYSLLKTCYMSQMISKVFVHNSAYSVQLPYITQCGINTMCDNYQFIPFLALLCFKCSTRCKNKDKKPRAGRDIKSMSHRVSKILILCSKKNIKNSEY